jgi:hypothetical protein
MNYFVNWAHIYSVHFGIWVVFSIGCTIYRDGLPNVKDLGSLLKTALAVSTILSVFSSHSHVHYATFLTHLVN